MSDQRIMNVPVVFADRFYNLAFPEKYLKYYGKGDYHALQVFEA
jgi:hypothetical protein